MSSPSRTFPLTASSPAERVAKATSAILDALGEDPDREGLARTPDRVARSLAFLTSGMDRTPEQAVGNAIFEEDAEDMVLVRGVEFFSLCEHHLLPFHGRAHVAYLSAGRVIGLSKVPRLIDVFARRLQVQERLTRQVAGALESVLAPRGVAVMLEAVHFCMMMRGVQKQQSETATFAFRGAFRDSSSLRAEFLSAARDGSPPQSLDDRQSFSRPRGRV